MTEQFDDILKECGRYGRYQRRILWTVVLPASFIIGLTSTIKIFQVMVPENYWCDVTSYRASMYSIDEWKNLTIPRLKDGNFGKCSHYKILEENPLIISNETETCTRWNHSRDELVESFATWNGWLCDKEKYSANLLSCGAIGNSIGTFMLPFLSDKFTGRLKMYFFVITLELVASLLMIPISSYEAIMALCFIRGLAFQTNFQMPFTIALELVPPNNRELLSFYSFIAWTLGMSLTAFIAWAAPHWIYLILIGQCFNVVQYIFFWVLPESPRWLISKGRQKECLKTLESVAKVNEVTFDKKKINEALISLQKEDETRLNIKMLTQYPKLLKNCSLFSIELFLALLIYSCLLLNVKVIPDNYYLSFFIITMSELPSAFTSYLGTKYLGRRGTVIISNICVAILCSIAVAVQSRVIILVIVISLTKISITTNTFACHLASGEISPTYTRSSVMGFVVLCGMLGSVFSPQIITLNPKTYYSVLGGLSLVGLLVGFFLPETMELPLPQTNEEAENIGRGVPFWVWINHWNWKKYATVSQQEYQ